MNALRANRRLYEPVNLIGEVVAESDGDYVVACDAQEWVCRRAASCLLKPERGDTVMISGPDPDRAYLIAVLEQADPAMARLHAKGSLTISAEDGAISLVSGSTIALHSDETVSVDAPTVGIRSGQADIAIDALRYRGKEASVTIGYARWAGKVHELVVEQLIQIAGNALRMTDELDQTRAGTLSMEARQTARMHGKYGVLTGEELVKVDARQIHMG